MVRLACFGTLVAGCGRAAVVWRVCGAGGWTARVRPPARECGEAGWCGRGCLRASAGAGANTVARRADRRQPRAMAARLAPKPMPNVQPATAMASRHLARALANWDLARPSPDYLARPKWDHTIGDIIWPRHRWYAAIEPPTRQKGHQVGNLIPEYEVARHNKQMSSGVLPPTRPVYLAIPK